MELVQLLRGAGFSELAKETGVSIARFARLAKLMGAAQVALDSGDPRTELLYGGLHEHVAAIVVTFLWMNSSTRHELFEFLEHVDQHYPVLDGTRRGERRKGTSLSLAFPCMAVLAI